MKYTVDLIFSFSTAECAKAAKAQGVSFKDEKFKDSVTFFAAFDVSGKTYQ